ncbi:MAG: DUF4838 domain-containing protein [Armatimonadota bacterium]
MPRLVLIAVPLLLCAASAARADSVLVRGAQPQAAIYLPQDAPADVQRAAEELATYIGKISGAQLPVQALGADDPVPAQPLPILLDALAERAGLTVEATTRSREAFRVRAQPQRVLIAGESPRAVLYGAYAVLEQLGCRWFMDHEIGEVVPSSKDVVLPEMDLREQPAFFTRKIWGSRWSGESDWKVRNRIGGLPMATGHAWSGLVPPKEHFDAHPEYYPLVNGERSPGQLCTSNPEVVRLAAEAVIARFDANPDLPSASISADDGRHFCQCDNCRALDDPTYIEPSSGTVALSDRFQLFYNEIARRVAQRHPDKILNFYAYSDYTLPPRRAEHAPPNLMMWLAPIRFCRLHAIGSDLCPARTRLLDLIEGWDRIVSLKGYRGYTYNLAECVVPFSKVSIYANDLPLLKRLGFAAVNLETLNSWCIYAPHIYLAARLAWNPDQDAEALMADYYDKWLGPAGPHVRRYWERVDRAFASTDTHAGSFFGLDLIYTRGFLAQCERDLEQALAAAQTDAQRERVRLFQRGLENAGYYRALFDATNRADFARAKQVLDAMRAHIQTLIDDGYANHYTLNYTNRFLGPAVDEGYQRVTGGNRLVLQLPDRWRFIHDEDGDGEARGYAARDFDDGDWREVATYSATLGNQGVPDRFTWMWYRTRARLPDSPAGKALRLWFAEVDGLAKVYVNGQLVGESEKRRKPFEVDITDTARPGRHNVIAVQVDHTRMTELDLGGIVKPVMIYAPGA